MEDIDRENRLLNIYEVHQPHLLSSLEVISISCTEVLALCVADNQVDFRDRTEHKIQENNQNITCTHSHKFT